MNERIRELALQAKAFIVESEHAKIAEVSEVSLSKYEDFEKFAELIVRECTNMLPNDSIRNEEGVHMFYVIRDHFGVSPYEGVR